MALAVLTDFDGTISVTDASYELLDRFGEKGWYGIEKEALEGRMTIKEALMGEASMVRVPYAEAAEYLKGKVKLRDGFREFADWCCDNGVHLEICSDGFGSTIEVLLAHWGLEWIPWTSNMTELRAEGMLIDFPHWREGCPVNGNCKCSQLERLRRSHGDVIFVGDGTTDLCVARKADHVLARDRLHDILTKEGKEHIRWFDWSDVRAVVERSFAAFPGWEG
jgi:2,3-diketo-5-methylthio-1-phosphopentane phosphatase